jgi:hypothetical protein
MRHSYRLTGLLGCVVVLWIALGCGPQGDGPLDDDDDGGLRGALEVLVVDHGDGSADTKYILRPEGDDPLELEVDEPPPFVTGDRVVVHGTRSDGRVVVRAIRLDESDDDVASSEESLVGNGVRTRARAAVLLAHWGQPDGLTPDAARSRLFRAASSTARWKEENSYGLLELTGDAFGWFRIDAPQGCDYAAIASRARTAARNAGVDVDGYDHLLYYFPRTRDCRWSGLASVGRPLRPARDSWYNGSSGCVVLAHELLHNYGARHSRSYRCSGSRPIADRSSCTFDEYGDPFDVMGDGCFHTNNYQKAAQGWFGGCNTVTVNGDGAFDLVATQAASDDIQSLRVPVRPDLCPEGMSSCFYTVEYRQPEGRIEGDNSGAWHVYRGVLIHVVPPVDFSGRSRPTHPYLLDMHPSTRTMADAALLDGETFEDPAGVRIRVASADGARARVHVERPGGSGGALCIDGRPPGDAPPTGDGSPPSVTLVAPDHGAVRAPRSQLAVAARVEDEAGLARVELLWTHGSHSWVVDCATAGGAFACTRSGDTHTWTVQLGGEGTRAWRVRATDTSGNVTTSGTRTLDVTSTPRTGEAHPVVDLRFPDNAVTLPGHATIHLRASVQSPVGVEGAELHWWDDGTTTAIDCATASGAVSCSRAGDVFTWALRVGDGPARFWRVQGTDAHGRRTTSPWRRISSR